MLKTVHINVALWLKLALWCEGRSELESCLDNYTNDDNDEDAVNNDEKDEVDTELDFDNQDNNVTIFSCRIYWNLSK